MITKTEFWKVIKLALQDNARSNIITERVMKKIKEQENKESENK